MRKKIYVGKIRSSYPLEILRSEKNLNEMNTSLDIFPNYVYVIGPFNTVRAAQWCIDHPHAQCTTIKEFEHIALLQQTQSELITGYKKHLNG